MPFPNLDGRPAQYTDEEAVKKLVEYCQICSANKELPNRAGLAVYMGLNKDTVEEYSKKYTHFSVSYGLMMQAQEDALWQKGLKNEYNANITKFMLQNHGYSDKSQVDQTVKATVEEKPDMDTKEKIDYLMSKLEEQKKLLTTDEASGA